MTEGQFEVRKQRAERDVFVITATPKGLRVRSARNPSRFYTVSANHAGPNRLGVSINVEGEKVGDRHPQTLGNFLKGFKRRGVDSSFHKAEEVHRDVEHLSESFLSHAALRSNLAQP